MSKIVVVGSTGQISIGKKWAGRQVMVTEVSSSKLSIEEGLFIPEHQKCFYTQEALSRLEEFHEWEKTHPPIASNIKQVFSELKKKKRSRDKSKNKV